MSRYRDRLPHSYEEAEKALRGRHVRTVLNNTRVSRKHKGCIEVQYHQNTIATFYADGTMEFTTCGWATGSTHERLNAMVPADIAFVRREYVGHIELREPEARDWVHPLNHADTISIRPDGMIHDIGKRH